MEHWSWQGVELRARAPGCWNDGIMYWRLSIVAVASLRRTTPYQRKWRGTRGR